MSKSSPSVVNAPRRRNVHNLSKGATQAFRADVLEFVRYGNARGDQPTVPVVVEGLSDLHPEIPRNKARYVIIGLYRSGFLSYSGSVVSASGSHTHSLRITASGTLALDAYRKKNGVTQPRAAAGFGQRLAAMQNLTLQELKEVSDLCIDVVVPIPTGPEGIFDLQELIARCCTDIRDLQAAIDIVKERAARAVPAFNPFAPPAAPAALPDPAPVLTLPVAAPGQPDTAVVIINGVEIPLFVFDQIRDYLKKSK